MSLTLLSFQEVWARVDGVDGWLTAEEAAALYGAAMQTPQDGLIVEVGSYKGRSLTVLAETGRRVLAVDPLELGVSIAKTAITEETVAALQAVVDAYPNVEWIRKRSGEVNPPHDIDLLYIDASHRYPHPLEDFRAFQKYLKPEALVAWHDYGRDFGVTKSVDELIASGEFTWLSKNGTMVIGTLP